MDAARTVSRRSLLRGRLRNSDAIRPPWSPEEDVFTDLCRRCGDCVAACETGLLINGSGGFPEADFKRAGCSFCEQCVTACSHKVLDATTGEPWSIIAQIKDTCLAANGVHCRTCQDQCEPEAISFQLQPGGIAQPSIDVSSCTGCGECISGCPVTAIEMQRPSVQQPIQRSLEQQLSATTVL
ncbi:ferredoxin-type protein NapF [Spongorhabdus nitratireducens]